MPTLGKHVFTTDPEAPLDSLGDVGKVLMCMAKPDFHFEYPRQIDTWFDPIFAMTVSNAIPTTTIDHPLRIKYYWGYGYADLLSMHDVWRLVAVVVN